ncbi:MAG: 2,3,4,5-tetrahydropyridine-2,6-dicarboxylate N-succinyltransferase [Bacteroidales bacterium]|nr:2,3,4,5-tetrahydropyridine-2,6-dicarboxylate N-succinyltransferase [Bacteroidales bacterium]
MNEELKRFNEVCDALERGELRVAEKKDGEWVVNTWIKEMILSGFRLGKMVDRSLDGNHGYPFFDKDTVLPRKFTLEDNVRIVPGGTSIRRGAYLAPGVIVMPPAFVNIGAYVDEGTMIDSHAVVGSCAQVGKRVHLAANSQIGGVLEPIGAVPVIIEDDVFIGGACGIYEGTVVSSRAVIATGVIINRATPVYDAVNGTWIRANDQGRIVIPEGAVVVSGSRPMRKGPGVEEGIHIYTPVIIKYRNSKTEASIELEDFLR